MCDSVRLHNHKGAIVSGRGHSKSIIEYTRSIPHYRLPQQAISAMSTPEET